MQRISLNITTIRGSDWLTVEIDTDITNLLLNKTGTKLPYTREGLAEVESVIGDALQRGVGRNFLQGYEINMPAYENIPFSDFASRILQNIKFTGYLAGAIHVIKIQGNLTYQTGE